MLGIHALRASLSLIREQGIQRIFDRVLANTAHVIELVETSGPGFSLLSNRDQARRSAIVSFAVEGVDPPTLHRRLMSRGIICACRGGGIRFSPHFYTSAEKIDKAWDQVIKESSDLLK
jgi:selenocysteine lyase/cysteine desulfurase